MVIALVTTISCFCYGSFKIGKVIQAEFFIRKNKRINEMVVASVFALITLAFQMIFIILWDVETVYPKLVTTIQGIRVSFLYTEREILLGLSISSIVCGMVTISLTFYEVAYHTKRLRTISDLLYIRRTVFSVCFILAVLASCLIGFQKRKIFSILFGALGVFMLLFFLFTVTFLTTELRNQHISSSNRRALRNDLVIVNANDQKKGQEEEVNAGEENSSEFRRLAQKIR